MHPDAIISGFIAASTTAPITWYLTRRFMSSQVETATALEYETRKNTLIDRTKETVVESADFLARLENEYRRGKEEGQRVELEKFSIVYEPYQDTIEEYMGLKKRAEIGYSSQLYYAGLPIGEPTRKVTHTNVEFDAARIDKIMNSELMGTLNNLCQLLVSKGIKGKVLPRR